MSEKKLSILVYADVINADIFILRYANQKERWTCRFEHCETKCANSSAILSSDYGNGSSAEEAIADYANKIKGKILVFNAMSESNRKQFVAPDYLTL